MAEEQMHNPDSDVVMVELPVGLIHVVIKYLQVGLGVRHIVISETDRETAKNFLKSLEKMVSLGDDV